MGFFGNLLRKLTGKKTDEEILNQMKTVIQSEMSESAGIMKAVSDLSANWNSLSQEQRAYYWVRIHKMIVQHEARERVLEELEKQLTKAERKSIFKKAKEEVAQL